MTIKENVYNKFGDKIGLSSKELDGNLHLDDEYGLDSLDIIDVVMEVEREYNIAIPDSEIPNLRTIDDFVKYIEDNTKVFQKPDKPTNHRIKRKPVVHKEARSENWYQ